MEYSRSLFLLVAVALVSFIGCTSDGDAPEEPGPGDTTPPVLIGSYPLDGATGVSRSGPYWFAFDEAMNAESVRNNISTSPYFGYDIHANASADTFWLTPQYVLTGNTVYEFNVGQECEDTAGNEMGTLVSIDFTTTPEQDMDPPTVVSTYPADNATGVNPGAAIRITFSEPVAYPGDWGSQTAIGIVPYPGDGYFEREGDDLLIWHSPFPVDSEIEVTVTTDLMDISGNNLEASYTFSFRTLNDTTRPYLASATPANGSSNVPTGTSGITLTFSEPMFPEFDMPAEDVDARIVLAMEEEPEWNTDFSRISLTFPDGLLPGCTYWVYFRNVTDMAGNYIDPNPTYYWFKTSGTTTYYPIAGNDLWYFFGYDSPLAKSPGLDMGSVKRVIENYNVSNGEFEEVWYTWDEGVWVIDEKTFMRDTGTTLLHLGREEYRDGVLDQTMMWDSPLTFLKLPPQSNLGDSWFIETTADLGEGYSMTISGTITISAGTVDVSVPIAEAIFRDCIVWTLYAEVTMYDNGTPEGGDEFLQTYFLAEGVGPVMLIDEDLTAPSVPDTIIVTGWDLH
jgi:methionine-rich copper-binding protein CopC